MTFNSTFAGGSKSLTITGNVDFDDMGSGLTTLNVSGTTQMDGGAITSTGKQTYQGAVTQSVDTTLTGSLVTFNSTFAGGSKSLAIVGNADFDRVVSGLTTLNISGTTQMDGGAITSSDTQTYQGAVTLGVETTLTGSTITFNSLVDGAQDLILNDIGTTTFVGAVGSTTAIGDGTGAAITINSTGMTEFQNTLQAASGITQTAGAGTVTFRDDVRVAVGDTNTTFNADVVLDGLTLTAAGTVTFGNETSDSLTISAALTTITTATANKAITVNSATTLSTDLTISAGNAEIELNGTVNGNYSLVLNSTGVTDINGQIGGSTPITSLTTNAGGTTYIGHNISAQGNTLTFNDAVVLDTQTITLTDTGPSTGSGQAGLTFNSTVNGAQDLILIITGPTTFVGAVGSTTPIGDGSGVAITVNSTGTTEFKSTLKTASGITQANGAGAVTFRDDVTIAAGDTGTAFNGDVVLDGLTLNVAGTVTFGNAGTDSLTISGAPTTITTAAANKAITVNSAATLNADLTINAGNATITLNGTMNGANDLILNTTGLTAINAVIGGTTPLASLTITTGGPFVVAQNITANGAIQVTVLDTGGSDDDLTVQGGATVQSNSSTITFDVGDDVDIQAGTSVIASQTVTINADPSNGDPDVFGATVTIAGTVTGSSVVVNGGDDADTFNIQRTAAATTLNAAGADDTINISSDAPANAGILDNIAAVLTVNGEAGTDTLNISDAGDTTGDAGILTNSQLSGLGAAVITYATVENLNVDLGSGDDTFAVQSTNIITTTTVDGNDGDDVFNVGNLGDSLDDILGLLFINGNDPTASDVLNINDHGDTDDNTYTLTGTTLDRTGMAQLTYGTIEELHLNAGLGADTIILSDTHEGTTTVNANDGDDMIIVQTTSGETTVNGQTGNDQAIVQTTGAGQGTTVNGDEGQDTVTLQATGLASTTTVNTGEDADIINVQTIAGETTINTGEGNDTVNVSSDAPTNSGLLDGIAAQLIVNGDSDLDTLNVSDARDDDNNSGDLTRSQLTGLDMAVGMTYSGFEAMNIQLGRAKDHFTVHQTHTGSTFVSGGSGDDYFVFTPNWGILTIGELIDDGQDTLDFSAVADDLSVFVTGNVVVTDGINTASHLDDNIEYFIGGSGNDIVHFADGAQFAGGEGVMDAGGGNNTLNYLSYTSNIFVHLAAVHATGTKKVVNFQNVYSGSGDDIIWGDSQTNILMGGIGMDSFIGGNGVDYIFGGPGDDHFDTLDYEVDYIETGMGRATFVTDAYDVINAGLGGFGGGGGTGGAGSPAPGSGGGGLQVDIVRGDESQFANLSPTNPTLLVGDPLMPGIPVTGITQDPYLYHLYNGILPSLHPLAGDYVEFQAGAGESARMSINNPLEIAAIMQSTNGSFIVGGSQQINGGLNTLNSDTWKVQRQGQEIELNVGEFVPVNGSTQVSTGNLKVLSSMTVDVTGGGGLLDQVGDEMMVSFAITPELIRDVDALGIMYYDEATGDFITLDAEIVYWDPTANAGLGGWVDDPPTPDAVGRIFTKQSITGTFVLVGMD